MKYIIILYFIFCFASQANAQQQANIIKYDTYGRLTAHPEKTAADCPQQSPKIGVLLVFGQSNSANHGGKRFVTENPTKVLNYFEGKCYIASSPLLGATGSGGEFSTPLADKLIENKLYNTVIIVSSGIGGTPISRWQEGGDLNSMLLSTLAQLTSKYKITDIIWHQGESDFMGKTSTTDYEKSFISLQSSLKKLNVHAPIFISIATKCGSDVNWIPDNPVAVGQRNLSNGETILIGADTDNALNVEDRMSDNCHFTESGLTKTSAAFAKTILNYHMSHYNFIGR